MNTLPKPRKLANRQAAGRELARELADFAGMENLVILALPRGGVPVAAEIAKALGLPFDMLVVRKLGVPGHEELAFGAISGSGVRVLNKNLIAMLGLRQKQIESITEIEKSELERREKFYRNGRKRPKIEGATVIVVDDGIATGSTMSAAIKLLRQQAARRIIVAVPVSPVDTAARLRKEADEVVSLFEPEQFVAVGQWYEDFTQTSDNEVRQLLAEANPMSAPIEKEPVALPSTKSVLGSIRDQPTHAIAFPPQPMLSFCNPPSH